MQIKKKHINKFQLAIRRDGIEPAPFRDLHDVCDPNAYAYDVLQIDVDENTIEIYNQFAEKWDQWMAKIKTVPYMAQIEAIYESFGWSLDTATFEEMEAAVCSHIAEMDISLHDAYEIATVINEREV